MSNFAFRELEGIDGIQKFCKLVIDEECQFDIYEDEINKNKKLSSQLGALYQAMQWVADLRSLPDTKFKDITPNKETVKEFEFKSKDLRIYAIKIEDGKLILIGGYKNKQNKDLRQFRSIKKRLLESGTL